MLELNDIAIDPTKSREGVWFDLMGGSFLLRRRGQEYKARLSELYQEQKKKEDAAKTPDVAANVAGLVYCYQRAFVEHVLLDWKGISKDGKAIKYSPDAALKILSDPKFSELADALEMFSLQHENYKEEAVAEVAKSVKRTAAS